MSEEPPEYRTRAGSRLAAPTGYIPSVENPSQSSGVAGLCLGLPVPHDCDAADKTGQKNLQNNACIGRLRMENGGMQTQIAVHEYPWVKVADGKWQKASECSECGMWGVLTEEKHNHCAWVPSYADEDGTGFENYTTTDWHFKCAHCGHEDGEQGGY